MVASGTPILSRRPLAVTTWLSPGLPVGLFQAIADHLGEALEVATELTVESKISGPLEPEDDRFSQGLTDVGFLCPPAYVWLRDPPVDSVRLVPLAPIHDDPRNDGRPVYFSDIVVRNDAPFERFDDLGGARFGYNDPSSLSGCLSVLSRLADQGLDPGFFGVFEHVGGHRDSLKGILDGRLDAAAIDANVWRTWSAANPDAAERLRSIDSLGPHPIQPVVVRTALADVLLEPIRAALSDPSLIARVRRYGVVGFGPIADHDFDVVATKARLVADVATTI